MPVSSKLQPMLQLARLEQQFLVVWHLTCPLSLGPNEAGRQKHDTTHH
ncbi:hypothetical protein SeF3a_217 [Salmonella phage SeF3a]|nr:hypothetical protein SeF3a_217 [Salmonella phage SeF3a]